jgi:3-deoxy-manno-octulosonate cytidylyltransferase (CMP-KDO synthetase)
MSKVIGVIPARYASTRFPGKPLAMIGSKPMIQWTYENSLRAKVLDELYVATDDQRIYDKVIEFGGKCFMTSKKHETGTDRLIEVGKIFSEDSIIVNIQGDEPGIEAELIQGVVELKKQNRNWEMTTASVKIVDEAEKLDPNRVKVVFTNDKRALYFSRSLIPSNQKKNSEVFKHLGIYVYENFFLQKYNQLPKSSYEESESLEQLRALQYGCTIGIYVTEKSALSVDTPEDLEKLVKDFKLNGFI